MTWWWWWWWRSLTGRAKGGSCALGWRAAIASRVQSWRQPSVHRLPAPPLHLQPGQGPVPLHERRPRQPGRRAPRALAVRHAAALPRALGRRRRRGRGGRGLAAGQPRQGAPQDPPGAIQGVGARSTVFACARDVRSPPPRPLCDRQARALEQRARESRTCSLSACVCVCECVCVCVRACVCPAWARRCWTRRRCRTTFTSICSTGPAKTLWRWAWARACTSGPPPPARCARGRACVWRVTGRGVPGQQASCVLQRWQGMERCGAVWGPLPAGDQAVRPGSCRQRGVRVVER